MLGILIALLALSFIVFIHELGHALAAVALGVKVDVFSIGIGRPLFSFYLGETQVKITPFLFGGYCKMRGSDSIETIIDHNDYSHLPKGSFLSASPLTRAIIYFCGPLANIIFAFIIFSVVSFMGLSLPDYEPEIVPSEGYSAYFNPADRVLSVNEQDISFYSEIYKFLPQELEPVTFIVDRNNVEEKIVVDTSQSLFIKNITPFIPLKVEGVQDNSPAKLAGLRKGDKVISVDGNSVFYFNQLEKTKQENKTGTFLINILREGELIPLTLYTASDKWGIYFGGSSIIREEKASSIEDAIYQGFSQTATFLEKSFIGIWGLILSPFSNSQNISGPIGIASQLSTAQTLGISIWLEFIGIISASLAAMNLFFPISILDGGQIFIIFIEAIRRKRFTPKTLMKIHSVGLFIVLGLLILGVFNDISFLSH